MALKLMYITNRPEVAKIAENAGVDRIFVDMEYIGKDERQAGLDTVKSHHTIDDIKRIKNSVTKAKVLVRVNPIHEASSQYMGSRKEIDSAILAGADILMLPMFKSVEEVEKFVNFVDGRAKTMLLLETPEAVDLIEKIVDIKGIDSIHIGLNDLHLALHKKFMFELLADGTVDNICSVIASKNIPYGFGGIARIGYGILPAEYVIKEHYRLGSSYAILSRAFCNVDKMNSITEIEQLFTTEMIHIRDEEICASKMSNKELLDNHIAVKRLVNEIVLDN